MTAKIEKGKRLILLGLPVRTAGPEAPKLPRLSIRIPVSVVPAIVAAAEDVSHEH